MCGVRTGCDARRTRPWLDGHDPSFCGATPRSTADDIPWGLRDSRGRSSRRGVRGGRIDGRGEIAQLVEHATENRGVGGSSPPLAIRGSGAIRFGPAMPAPGPNPQESPGNKRHVRHGLSSEGPANPPVFGPIGSRLKIVVSPVRVRVSPCISSLLKGGTPRRLAPGWIHSVVACPARRAGASSIPRCRPERARTPPDSRSGQIATHSGYPARNVPNGNISSQSPFSSTILSRSGQCQPT
jgi:hypothetical protein